MFILDVLFLPHNVKYVAVVCKRLLYVGFVIMGWNSLTLAMLCGCALDLLQQSYLYYYSGLHPKREH